MIKLGIEATCVCNPNPSGIANYTINIIDGLLASSDFKTKFDLNLIFEIN